MRLEKMMTNSIPEESDIVYPKQGRCRPLSANVSPICVKHIQFVVAISCKVSLTMITACSHCDTVPPKRDLLSDLPSEIASLILVYSHVNGDLASVRLVSRRLSDLASRGCRTFVETTCCQYGIASQVFKSYQDTVNQGQIRTHEDDLLPILALRSELQTLNLLATPATRQNTDDGDRTVLGLLLFSILSRKLQAKPGGDGSGKRILACNDTINGIRSLSVGQELLHHLDSDVSLAELEGMISAINLSAAKLWTFLLFSKPAHARTMSYVSLGGPPFSVDQALVTEHVIWKGPKWVASMLEQQKSSGEVKGVPSKTLVEFDELLRSHGPWRGSNEDGARIAAGGMARFLWSQRTGKVEGELETHKRETPEGKFQIAELRVNAGVWRGSAGDM